MGISREDLKEAKKSGRIQGRAEIQKEIQLLLGLPAR